MVKQLTKGKNKYYQCEECKLFYKDENMAKKCQIWCKKHNSCNLDLIKYSVKVKT